MDKKANALNPAYAAKPGLFIKKTELKYLKEIDDTMLNIYRMIVIAFSVTDKANQFFEMLFPTLSNADVDFLN